MQPGSEIRDVSDTAIWVAHYRAMESERPDAMFRDPLARILTGERGRQIAGAFGPTSRYTAWTVITRTVLIDDFIEEAIRDGVDVVLNLGAGLDTRPYRLNLPSSLLWVEADFPHMVDYKKRQLQAHEPQCQLQRIGVDLADDAARRELLAKVAPHARKILVLTEGVIPYLTEAQVAGLAKDLLVHPRYALWLAEFFAPQVYPYLRAAARAPQMAKAPFRFFPAGWEAFFLAQGWAFKDLRYTGSVAGRFNRMPPMPWWGKLLSRFASKAALQRATSVTGFVLMQPATTSEPPSPDAAD